MAHRFCRRFFLLLRRQAEHLQQREQQHDLREDHRHADGHHRLRQIADQRQRDGRHAGAQPVPGGFPQMADDEPQPRAQPQDAGGQQLFQVLIMGGIEGVHARGQIAARPVHHGGVHHAGAHADPLAPHRLVQPGTPGDAPGRAAVGAPVVVDDQNIVQAPQAGEAWPEVCQCIQQQAAYHQDGGHHAPGPPERDLPPAQAKAQQRPQRRAHHEADARHAPQRRQHRRAALGVDVFPHIVHPARVEKEERPQHGQTAHGPGGEDLLAHQHQHRRADAQRQPFGVHHRQRQPAEEGRDAVEHRMARAPRHQKGIEHQRQRKGHEPGVEVFLPQRGKELRALDDGGIFIGPDQVDVEDVEHIQHRDRRDRQPDAEGQAVEQVLRREGPHDQIPDRREQDHHKAAVIAAQPPQGGHRRQGKYRGDQPRKYERRQRPEGRVPRPEPSTRRARPHKGQRPDPEREHQKQGADRRELDDAEVGKLVDI